jgi:ferredoxin
MDIHHKVQDASVKDGAPFINEDGVSEIPLSAFMGCGICASECPAKAIELKHSTDDQLLAKIDALLESAIKDDYRMIYCIFRKKMFFKCRMA